MQYVICGIHMRVLIMQIQHKWHAAMQHIKCIDKVNPGKCSQQTTRRAHGVRVRIYVHAAHKHMQCEGQAVHIWQAARHVESETSRQSKHMDKASNE